MIFLRNFVPIKVGKKGGTYKTLYIVIPSDVAKLLNIKEGDELNMTITDIEVEGTKRKALIYYK